MVLWIEENLILSRSAFFVFLVPLKEQLFLIVIWLPQIQLWAIIKGVASFTWC